MKLLLCNCVLEAELCSAVGPWHVFPCVWLTSDGFLLRDRAAQMQPLLGAPCTHSALSGSLLAHLFWISAAVGKAWVLADEEGIFFFANPCSRITNLYLFTLVSVTEGTAVTSKKFQRERE